MATTEEYIKFVCERLGGFNVRYKKMFGDYMVYVDDKPIFLVCDSTVYIKKLEPLQELMAEAECGIPYEGSKEHYILDIENDELTRQAVEILVQITKVPVKRKR